MSMASELIAAVMAAERELEMQISFLTAYLRSNDDLMKEVSTAVEGSSHGSARKISEAISQTKERITFTVNYLEAAKTTLSNVRQI